VFEPVRRLIRELALLPGIGEKTAERLAFHLLARPAEDALRLADAVRDLKEKLLLCSSCRNVSDADPCSICADPRRDAGLVMVVESPKDVWTIERTGAYRGTYHVLHGRISPLDGVGPEQLTVDALCARIARGGIAEVVLATNPTAEGDATAAHLHEVLSKYPVRISRIARGLPPGSAIEYASRAVLAAAIMGRREMDGE
jgi:recombination protein RecR